MSCKKALIVIDMQNDYLWEKRKPRFTYDTEALVNGVNALVHSYSDNGSDVIYIKHIIQNLPTNRLLFGYSIAGTEGAEIYKGIDIVSDLIFTKMLGDALTNKKLRELINERAYDELHLCGLDKYGCVTATALGCAKRGIKAKILQSGTASVLPAKKQTKQQQKLNKAGIETVDSL